MGHKFHNMKPWRFIAGNKYYVCFPWIRFVFFIWGEQYARYQISFSTFSLSLFLFPLREYLKSSSKACHSEMVPYLLGFLGFPTIPHAHSTLRHSWGVFSETLVWRLCPGLVPSHTKCSPLFGGGNPGSSLYLSPSLPLPQCSSLNGDGTLAETHFVSVHLCMRRCACVSHRTVFISEWWWEFLEAGRQSCLYLEFSA